MNYLLDTCALLHYSLEPGRLTTHAIDEISREENNIWVSAISVGELACLQSRGRINIRGHWKMWFREEVEENGWNVLPITREIMEDAYSLPSRSIEIPQIACLSLARGKITCL